MIVSPSPDNLKRPFQLETDFILAPLDFLCFEVEAAADPMERRRRKEEEEGERREGEVEVEVEARRLRVAAAPVHCC